MAVLLVEREADMQLWTEEGGGPTLDDVLSGAWEGLAAASPSRARSAAASSRRAGRPAPAWSAAAAATAESSLGLR